MASSSPQEQHQEQLIAIELEEASKLESIVENYDLTMQQLKSIKYVSSIKGGCQLTLDGFPYTRHRVRAATTYWRCVQFKPLRCKARVRTKANGKQLEIVERNHNHSMLLERRKKGSLKAINAIRKRIIKSTET